MLGCAWRKIEDGETAEHAFLREMDEELGWAPSKSQLACVFESMFEHESQTYQQYGFYFNADAEDLWQRQGTPPAGQGFRERDETLVFCWYRLAELGEIDVRPPSLVPVLQNDRLKHIVHLVHGFNNF